MNYGVDDDGDGDCETYGLDDENTAVGLRTPLLRSSDHDIPAG